MKQAQALVLTLVTLGLALSGGPLLAAENAGVVNINTASADALALLPRVGPAVAQRIVDFREANGKFKQKEDLLLVRGIGERTFELLESYVAVEGETTLTEKVRVPRATEKAPDSE